MDATDKHRRAGGAGADSRGGNGGDSDGASLGDGSGGGGPEAPPQRACVEVAIPPGPAGVEVLMPALAAALTGTGPAVAVLPAQGPAQYLARIRTAVQPGAPVPREVAVVVATSGSTGDPAGVLLPGSALHSAAVGFEQLCRGRVEGARAAQAEGTAEGTVGAHPGNADTTAVNPDLGHRWVAALPLHHTGGLMVAVRSVFAGSTPVAMASLGGAQRFSVEAFATATDRALALSAQDGRPLAVSLVPPMLSLLDEAGASGRTLLARYGVVLVGGAATPTPLVARLRAAGVNIALSYGMTETCGGAVFDGRALPGVSVSTDATGRISICGATVAAGSRDGRDIERWSTAADGTRCLRTGDLGQVGSDGLVRVTGRVDDVVQVGGASVSLAAIRAVLLEDPRVAEAEAVAVPHKRFGVTIAAFVVPARHPDDRLVDDLGDAVTARLGRAARPRLVQGIDAVPMLAAGKPDRRALAERAHLALDAAGAPAPHDRIRP